MVLNNLAILWIGDFDSWLSDTGEATGWAKHL